MVDLFVRTGTEVLAFIVRSNSQAFNQPYLLESSPRIGQYFHSTFGMPPSEFVVKLEGFCVSGKDDVTLQTPASELQELRSVCSASIMQHLRDVAAPEVVPKMHYQGFFEHIMKRHHIIYQNWPVRFERPSVMGIVELRTLNDYLQKEDAPPLFRKLSAEEWVNFEAALSHATAASETSPEQEVGPRQADEDISMNVDEETDLRAPGKGSHDISKGPTNKTTYGGAAGGPESGEAAGSQAAGTSTQTDILEDSTASSGLQEPETMPEVGALANTASPSGAGALGTQMSIQTDGAFGVFSAFAEQAVAPHKERQERWDKHMSRVQKARYLAEQAAQMEAEANQAGTTAVAIRGLQRGRGRARGRGQAAPARGQGQGGRGRGRGQASRGQEGQGRGRGGGTGTGRGTGQAGQDQVTRGGQATREQPMQGPSHGLSAEGSHGNSQ